jgi:hypothetical protein
VVVSWSDGLHAAFQRSTSTAARIGARAPASHHRLAWLQAPDPPRIRSIASARIPLDDANENRTKSLPDGPNAAPGIAATPA